VDYDGDGFADLVLVGTTQIAVQRNITTPAGAITFASTSQTILTLPSGKAGSFPPLAGGIAIADFNGDGRADLAVTVTDLNNHTASTYAVLSNGFGNAATVPQPLAGRFSLVDWNGDGCTDLANTSYIFVSNCGGGFSTISTGLGAVGSMAVDWDGDGRTDLLYSSNNEWYVLRSTGNSFAPAQDTGLAAPVGTSWFVLDQNGDALADLGYVDSNNGNALKYVLHAGSYTSPDLATSFTDGLGMNQSPTYVPISHNNYTKVAGAVFPQQDYQGALYVVDQFTASDGTGSTYQNQFWYSGARIQVQGRGFEGFLSRRTYDTRNALYTYDGFNQAFPYTGTASSRSVTSSTFASINTWTSTPSTQSITGLGGFEQRYFPFLSQTVFVQHEYLGSLNGTSITNKTINYSYGDGYGNPTQIQTTLQDQDPTSPFYTEVWVTTVDSAYSNDTAHWCLGLPTNTTVQSAVPGQNTDTRTYQFVPDSNGSHCRLAQSIIEPTSSNHALTVTSTLGYDPGGCGNVTSVAVVGHNPDGTVMPTRTTSFGYGARCQLPETVTNALNQSSTFAYNYDFGVPTQFIDPNAIKTMWFYDDFGRKNQETRPDQTISTYTYYSCNTPPCWGVNDLRMSVYRDDYKSDGSSEGAEGFYWDGFNRLRYDELTHVFGTLVYEKIAGYDSLGRLIWQYQPVSSGSNGYFGFAYDPLNRITSATLYQSNGSLDRTYLASYAGRTTTVQDPLSRTTRYASDVVGHLRRVTDPSPGGTTSYDYDAFGNLVAVTDPIGASATATYNLRGFRTQLHDPDVGQWNFHGDSLNELVSYFDGKFSSFGIAYDTLGRMTSRSEPEGISTWSWGNTASAHDIGSLDYRSTNGYSDNYAYDALGRLATRTIASDAVYQYNYSYNSIGAVDTITYPTSPAPAGTTNTRFAIQFGYSYGFPYQISDITQSTAKTLWTLTAANDYSSPTAETLGANLISVNSTYKPWTDEITSIQSGVSGSSTNRQNLAYAWDADGNLTERWDKIQNLREDFVPDALNRLSSSTLNTVANLSVSYDASGNITSRSDNGTYHYSATSPHQLLSVDNGYSASYDSNGNVTSRNGLAQTWASFNLPTTLQAKVGSSVYSSQFSYGPDHDRYQQSATYSNGSELTSYVGDLLEKVSGSATTTTHFRHYVPTPSGRTIVVYRNQDATTSTSYALSDHLGSTDAVLDAAGNLLVQESFGAFGGRRQSNWSVGNPSSSNYAAIAATTRRGYTFHEELDSVGLTHMNGRVYDPAIGRFLSADPVLGDLADSQSVNPYAYVGNRPLATIDPTGEDPALEQVVVETGGPTNPIGDIALVADVAFELSGLFGAGAPPPPPPATSLPGQSAQSGVGANVCGAGASAGCGTIDPVTGNINLETVLVFGVPPPPSAVGMAWGELGQIARVDLTPDDPVSVETVYVVTNGLPNAPAHRWGLSDFIYNLLIKQAFGWVDCAYTKCSAGQELVGLAGAPLMVIGGPEAEAAEVAVQGTRGAIQAERLLANPVLHEHHLLPQQFRGLFSRLGINIDEHTVTVSESVHLQGIHGSGLGSMPGRWNQQWAKWIEANPNATIKDVYQQLGRMMDDYGLSGAHIHPYGK
jgi:RHS repeat-associated protein